MTDATTAPRKPLTATTWTTQGIVRRGSGPSWEALTDLAHETAGALPHLDADAARVLLSGAHWGLPVNLTWDTPLRDGRWERTETPVIVLSVAVFPRRPKSSRIRISYWGFEYDVPLSRVVAASTPKANRTYFRR